MELKEYKSEGFARQEKVKAEGPKANPVEAEGYKPEEGLESPGALVAKSAQANDEPLRCGYGQVEGGHDLDPFDKERNVERLAKFNSQA